MNKLLLLAIGLQVLSIKLCGQSSFTIGIKTLGDYSAGRSVIPTHDGHYVVCGSYTFMLPSSNREAYLAKVSSSGSIIWAHTYGMLKEEEGWQVIQTMDKGFAIIGNASYNNVFDVNIILIKTDSVGVLKWMREYNTPGPAYEHGTSLLELNDKGFLLAAHFVPLGNGDPVIIRTDSTGNIVWSRSFGTSAYNESLSKIIQVSDGNFIGIGTIDTSSNYHYQIGVVKFNGAGQVLWGSKIRHPNFRLEGIDLLETAGKSIILSGSSSETNGNVYVCRLDSLGIFMWGKSIGGINTEKGCAMAGLANGGVLLGATTTSYGGDSTNLYILRVSGNGLLDSTRVYTLNASVAPASIQVAHDNGFILTGETGPYPYGATLWLMKVDSNWTGCDPFVNGGSVSNIGASSSWANSYSVTFSSTSGGTDSTAGVVINLCNPMSQANIQMGSSVQIYPNPSNGVGSISSEYKIVSVEFFDLPGRRIQTVIANDTKVDFSLKGHSDGAYFYNVLLEDGKTIVGKLLISKGQQAE